MDHAAVCRAAADELAAIEASFAPRVLVGFDGFVDQIISAVDRRHAPDSFDAMPTITTLGERITAAAGRSTNIELVVRQSKVGGNGPIMAGGLLGHGVQLVLSGILGDGDVHPVFADIAQRAVAVHSLGQPAHTDALEFDDGKVMFGKLQALDRIDFDAVATAFGGIEGLRTELARVDGLAMVNWTMTMAMTEIWRRLADEVLPGLRTDRPACFVDLADPAKRSREDLVAAMRVLGRLQGHLDVVLGLNEMEGRQVLAAIGDQWTGESEDLSAADHCCRRVRDELGLSCVTVHMVRGAAAADASGSAAAEGFFAAKPLITTGAGDHYNAGFFLARMASLSLLSSVQIGAATSGHYVRTAVSPCREEVIGFLRRNDDR